MDLRLDGKTALVTGASKGIGYAIAELYAACGANVMLSSRKPDALAAAVEQARPSATGVLAFHAANAGDPDAAVETVAATMEEFGSVDILVNNAATNPYFGPAVDVEVSQFDKISDVNLRGPLLWSQAAHRASMAASGGVILNMASIGGMGIEHGIGIYNTSKAGLIHLTRVLASELAPDVRVNAIAPGLVKTDMARALWEEHEEAVAKRIPMRRLGAPVDIAHMALFLASDAASWITGQTFAVDGGLMVAG
ncbi:MAG TPA: SDR family oxidoreductase [Acidimicrobiales bacterium]|jgi:NAD(P)-dependent dehydrogenase (short-subunit alcohol dehydrogenase family)|nr:SDR family oxidoreductase [Acidimicrobiales bacterium]